MKKILLQLDPDPQTSVFDSVVAVDSDVDQLFRHHNVAPEQVTGLVHGCIFTRGGDDLKNSAIFVGGSDVHEGEEIFEAVLKAFFGPMRVSVMMDANGCNTTAAAAVLAAAKHVDLADASVGVLAGTGPVGQRVARLCLRQGSKVKLCSRKLERAQEICDAFDQELAGDRLMAMQAAYESETREALADVNVVFATGAAGIELLSESARTSLTDTKVFIDLNAVPPLGIGGIEVFDKAIERDNQICYGAIGVGGTKMKIHKAAIRQLFDSNDRILNAEEIFDIGMNLD